MSDHRVHPETLAGDPFAHAGSAAAKLAKLEERHAHELMDYEERCLIWSRIAAARAEIAEEKAKG